MYHYSASIPMPTQSCNTTKKAPSRAKGTKSNSGSRNGKGTKKATNSRKRAATESGNESQTEDLDEPTVKTPRHKKARVAKKYDESEKEVEEVEENTVPPVEVISDVEEADSPNENEVSNNNKKREVLNLQVP
jgi:hypothetical protein